MVPVLSVRRINSEAVSLAGILKEGNFSEVHVAYLNGRKIVAKKFKGCQSEQKKEFLYDISKFHRKLEKHDYIINILGYCDKFENDFILMEYEALYTRGKLIHDLSEYLIHLREEWDTRRRGKFIMGHRVENSFPGVNHQELHSFSYQILQGCEYLESNGIVHGNLAARNILISRNKTIKLADFGFLKLKSDLIDLTGGDLSYYRWASYEILQEKSYTFKSDVWAFGTVLWEIGTLGAHPYPRISTEEVVKCLRQQKSIIELGPGEQYINFFSEKLYNIMNICTSKEPDCRPDFKWLLSEFRMNKCDPSKKHGCAFYKKVNELGLNAQLEFLPTKYDLEEKKPAKLEFFYDYIFSKFSKIKFLAEGKFGYVKTITLDDPILGNITAAIKEIFGGEKPVSAEKKIWFNGDIENFKKIGNHRNVIKILAVCKNPIAIMMEYQSIFVNNGMTEQNNLNQYLKYLRTEISHGGNSMHNEELGWFAIQIARGMKHLEGLNILHCNLTTKNVLINNAKILKISDFCLQGTGIYKSMNGEATMKVENYRWAAPEVLKSESYSLKSDVWAFAIVLWEIATLGAHPFGAQSEKFVKNFIVHSRGILQQPKNASEELWDLMRSCWIENLNARPNFKTIFQELNCLNVKRDIFTRFDCFQSSNFLPTEEDCRIQTELKNIAHSHSNPRPMSPFQHPPSFEAYNPSAFALEVKQEQGYSEAENRVKSNQTFYPSQQPIQQVLPFHPSQPHQPYCQYHPYHRRPCTPNPQYKVRFSGEQPPLSQRSRSLPRQAHQIYDEHDNLCFLNPNFRKSTENIRRSWGSGYLWQDQFYPQGEGYSEAQNRVNSNGTAKPGMGRMSLKTEHEKSILKRRVTPAYSVEKLDTGNICNHCYYESDSCQCC